MPRIALALAALVGAAAAALPAGGAPPQGAELYSRHCVPCHGPAGRGDGPRAGSLEYAPPDLTLIAHRNGGRFPRERVRKIVDGRTPPRGLKPHEMPIWGDVLKERSEGYSEKVVAERVDALVRLLESWQRKPRD